MTEKLHSFHIPVMGIGHSIDTALRVAPLGISSVVSLVDDGLIEKIRQYYCQQNNVSFIPIASSELDSRAKRITAYLNLLRELVLKKIDDIRQQSYFEDNEKKSYFDLLPEDCALKKEYLQFLNMSPGYDRDLKALELNSRMKPGAIDVNIMVKLDRTRYDHNGHPLTDEFSDAKAALRGFANSDLESSIVFSAGLNPRLFSYASQFRDFYRDTVGQFKKKIIIKVSDFRSALIQSKFLAKHGLEVSEYRVESSLNCGGHAFSSQGQLLPWILTEFKEKWRQLTEGLQALVEHNYAKNGRPYIRPAHWAPALTVQGGIGTVGEARRLHEDFGVDRTGWGSPFLLVPEVTNVDDASRELLRQAEEDDLYLSDISPLGIPFNTVKGTGSEKWTQQRIDLGKPGSPCPSGFAVTNTEFTERPICIASRQYQKKKLDQIDQMDISLDEKEQLKNDVLQKTCICVHLGNGILIKLGLAEEPSAPQAICPGPNIAWFDRFYSLKEMVDHIYGRAKSLVPAHRPHMFAKEITMNVDFFERLVHKLKNMPQGQESLKEYKSNLEKGIALCQKISEKSPFHQENLDSLRDCVQEQLKRLQTVFEQYSSSPALAPMFS